MSKKEFFKRYALPLAILSSAMFILFANPFSKLAKESETTKEIATYSNTELKQTHEKYNRLMLSLHNHLSENGYPLVVDFALSDDEMIEILIKKYEMIKNLTPDEMQEVEQLVNQFIKKQNFDPSMFTIKVSNTTLKTTNRLSYHDLMDYIVNALTDQDIGGYHMNYKISPETSEMIMQFPNPLDQKQKEEILQTVNTVLEKNNFDDHSVQIKLMNFLSKAENLSTENQLAVEKLYEELQKDDGFIEQVGRALNKAGYMDSISGTVYSPNGIELFFDYPDDETKQNEIKSIFENYMTKFNLNAEAFHIKFNVDDLNY